MNKIEHIGIAVQDIEKSSGIYERLLGIKSYKQEIIVSESVITEFFKVGDGKIELLKATSSDSAIAKFIEKKGEGIHHIAFLVDDIFKEIEHLKGEGFKFVSDVPKPGADNKLVCFVHPKDTSGVLIELCQEII